MNDNLETDLPGDSKTEELPKQTDAPGFNQLGINDNISSGQGAEVSNAQAMSIQDMLTALFEKFTIKEQEREKQRELKERERERQRQQEKEKRRQEKLIEKQQQELRDQEKEKKFMENINNIFLERDKEIVRRPAGRLCREQRLWLTWQTDRKEPAANGPDVARLPQHSWQLRRETRPHLRECCRRLPPAACTLNKGGEPAAAKGPRTGTSQTAAASGERCARKTPCLSEAASALLWVSLE
ncbi:trichohyalin-like [Schistocerca americana]|uniref:trichohyalin-like n=1 Tax=Schistocerca americana TaxID=7009 RepID=UPI001F4FA80C|nr:trichohyalin-like [Schistocerca americana]